MIGMRSPAAARAAAPTAFARGGSAAARRVAGSGAAARRRPSLAARASPGSVAPELKQEIDALLSEHRVVLFMKGTKAFPMCGFSGTCVQILRTLSVGGGELPFHTVNILEREDLRSGMKAFSQWPTFPQVYIDGEFFGGCDIMLGEKRRLSVGSGGGGGRRARSARAALFYFLFFVRRPRFPAHNQFLLVAARLPKQQQQRTDRRLPVGRAAGDGRARDGCVMTTVKKKGARRWVASGAAPAFFARHIMRQPTNAPLQRTKARVDTERSQLM